MASKFAEIYVLLGLKKEGFDKGVKSTQAGMKDLGKAFITSTAAIAGVGVAVIAAGKQIFELGKSGAGAIQLGESFDFLLEKVGAAPDLLDQLKKATLGTVDSQTLMSSTLTLAAGAGDKLTKMMMESAPQLATIAKAANKLNPSLGTTAFMYQSIGTGVKRAQPLILDNLGLTIKVGDANQAMADQLGKSVEALTAEEKSMAILNATLAAGDTLIAQVGGSVDASTDSFEILEATIADTTDLIKSGLSPSISEIVTAFNEWIAAQNRSEAATKAVEQAILDQILSEKEGIDVLNAYIEGQITEEQMLMRLEQANRNWQVEMGVADWQLVELTGSERAHELQLIAEKAALEGLTVVTAEQQAAADLLNISMKAYTEALLYNIIAADMDKDAAYALAVEFGLVDERSIAAQKSVALLTEKYDLNGNDLIDLVEMTDEYTAAVNRLQASLDAIPSMQTKGLHFKITTGPGAGGVGAGKPSGVTPPSTYVPLPPLPTNRGFAAGGAIGAGGSYMVGEAGPEMFVPRTGGDIIPNGGSATIGSNMMAGISGGVRGGYEDTAKDTMNAMGGLVASAEKALGISSPSAMFYDIGLAMMAGLEKGIQRGQRGVTDALDDVMKDMNDTTYSWYQRFEDGSWIHWNNEVGIIERGMDEVKKKAKKGFDGIIGEAERGATGIIDEAERGMRGAQDATREGFDGMIGEAERGMRGFNDAVYQGITYTQKMMDESYANMLKYWEDAGSIFGGENPITGFIPPVIDYPPPPSPYVPPDTDNNPLLPYNPADQPKSPGELDRNAPDPGTTYTPEPELPYVPPPIDDDYTPPPPYNPFGYPSGPTAPPVINNTLYITTNAAVTSDVPDLLLLRAWASG